jgi:hypothetical protein
MRAPGCNVVSDDLAKEMCGFFRGDDRFHAGNFSISC